ncbi:hypothetical protein [Alkalicoccobacillus porphyridii]|uniref:hypothetical protein n=1 Tax=Alkalicoccobacillus porphyridii TaxID=2597270 RepID=UPI00163DCD32|nr:hypothetical protein [Alkalicoccobacillus porphyridii]
MVIAPIIYEKAEDLFTTGVKFLFCINSHIKAYLKQADKIGGPTPAGRTGLLK